MMTAVPNPFLNGLLALSLRPVATELSDTHLRKILTRELVSNGLLSPANRIYATLGPIIQNWAGQHLSFVSFSGSYAKGTANRSGTDVDLLISLRSECTVPLKDICTSLKNRLIEEGYPATIQNVSVGTSFQGHRVDLVPARQRSPLTNDHSLFHKRTGTWRKTNVHKHVHLVCNCGRINEIRLVKLWRTQRNLDFPSFYLELAVMRALRGVWYGSLSANVLTVLDYLAGPFENDRIVDPANPTNVLSDDLTAAEKSQIRMSASASLASSWERIVF